MELNQYIDVSKKFAATDQMKAIEADNAAKTNFALNMMARMPQQEPPKAEPPKIPSLGALAIPN